MSTAASSSTERLWQVDALRGLMLVLMTLTHLPTRVSSPAGQPFGYVSAAEGFVLLSGFMAGMVYAGRHQREGAPLMREAFLKRVAKIYLCQAALLVFLFSLVALIGLSTGQPAITNLMKFYLEHPGPALAGSLLLLYNPPLLDILPMYILFMLASPLLLVRGLERGWGAILVTSIALWLASQFGLGHWLYDALVGATGLPVPFQETGSFEVLAWQFLWVLGLWIGASRVTAPEHLPDRFPRWMVAVAAIVAAIGFTWRHAVGQAPFPNDMTLTLLFDKWQLAPLRLINLFALLVLAIHFAPWLRDHLPRLRWLETLGAASLGVFCAHLALALLALALFGEPTPTRSGAVDLAILAVSGAVLYGVALASRQIDQHGAAVRRRFKARRSAAPSPRPAPPTATSAPPSSAGARRSPPSTLHSPPR